MELKDLMKKYGTEKVLCIENKYVKDTRNLSKFIETMSLRCFSQLRAEAELDTNSRQIIPYVVLEKFDGVKRTIFVTKRLKGDERLKGQVSIGTGGHIDVSDISMEQIDTFKINMYETIENCILRELEEETTITNTKELIEYTLDCKDVFIDDSTDVSKVHLCMLFTLSIPPEMEIEIKETDKLKGEWVLFEDIAKIKKLETWSEKAYEILCR